MQESQVLFESAIKSKITLESYRKRLSEFLDFSNIASYDELALLDRKNAENKIILFINKYKDKVNPNSIPGRIAGPMLFFAMNDVLLNVKKIRKTLPIAIKRDGAYPYKMEDIQKILACSKSHRDRSIVSFMTSTGVRPAVITELLMKDIDENKITVYAGSIEEYTAFLTPEARKYLSIYFENRRANGEIITPESPVFRSRYIKGKGNDNVSMISYGALKVSMYKMVDDSGIRTRFSSSNKRHGVALFGGFRKFFTTTLNNIREINPNITEKLLGHRNDLRGTYYNPDSDERYKNFKLAIPNLTISDKSRDKLKIEQLLTEKEELESLRNRMAQLEERQAKQYNLKKAWTGKVAKNPMIEIDMIQKSLDQRRKALLE